MGTPRTTPITEGRHQWGFLVWDPSDGIVTRGEGTFITPAASLSPGLVLAELASEAATMTADAGNTGNGTVTAGPTAGASAVNGAYLVEFTAATAFTVYGPTGAQQSTGTTGAAYSNSGVGFTITAGGTAFVAGDSFEIVVANGGWVAWDPTGAAGAGSNVIAGILGTYVFESPDNVVAGILLNGPARVNSSELEWGATVTKTEQQLEALAALAKLGIQSSPGAAGLATPA